ncbi:YkvA family protein [Henriciella aquimarina]|uniref:YkvA family protein n=1 Tax=Henriciella aquimarina TaxID=545261 RepID=UPI000A03F0A9|nr:YkvA family protein [Henriciella aquimarina]
MRNPREVVIENGESWPTYLPLAVEKDEQRTRRRLLPKLLRVAGRIPFADDLAAAYYAAVDPETPRKAKAVLFGALAYFVLPTDAVPDIIVGFGFSDDATVLATALTIVGSQVRERHRKAARRLLGRPEPESDEAEA